MHVDRAGEAHIRGIGADIERIARRERLRPIALPGLAAHREAEQLGELHDFAFGVVLGDLVADREQRVLRLDQHLGDGLDVLVIRPDLHRDIEEAAVIDRGRRLAAQQIVRDREEDGAGRRRLREFQDAPRHIGDVRRRFRQPPILGDRRHHLLLMLVILRVVAAFDLGAESGDRQQHRNVILVAVDELRHAVRQADIGDMGNAELARQPRIAVGHRDHRAFLDALDELDLGDVDQRVIERRVAGRRIEEDVFHASGFELLHVKRAAIATHLADRAAGRGLLRHGRRDRQRIDDRFRHPTRQAGRTEAPHQRAPRNSILQILLDEIFHRSLLPFDPGQLSAWAPDRWEDARFPSHPQRLHEPAAAQTALSLQETMHAAIGTRSFALTETTWPELLRRRRGPRHSR